MKTFVSSAIVTGALAASTVLGAETSNTWFDQWYRAKYGLNSPAVEARLKAERQSTAFREEITTARPLESWFDQWYRAKYGHNSPAVEARLKAERESTAFREEPARPFKPTSRAWLDQWYKAKYGLPSPLEKER